MTNEAIEAAAMAMCDFALGGKGCPCLEKGVFKCSDAHPADMARAAAPALMEEGARLALEAAKGAAYNAYLKLSASKVIWDAMAAIDPAAIVKGAHHDRR